jgi:hypothetical protein
MLIFSISFPNLIKFPYFMDTPERRVWGERRPKDRVSLQIILVFTLTRLKPFTLTLDLHVIYTTIDTDTYNTGSDSSSTKTNPVSSVYETIKTC